MAVLIVDNFFLSYAKALVENARHRIYIATFKAEISHKQRGRNLADFFSLIKSKAQERIHVWFLINWHDDRKCVARTNMLVSQELKNAGVKVRHLQHNRCCHAKILLVDNEKAIIGSHNLSVRSVQSNFEVSTLIEDPSSVARLAALFEHSFQAAKQF